jgi:hypothetical protein
MTAKQPNKRATPAVCPVCGEDVPRNAVACPECGADHKSGWRDDAPTYDGVDLPDEFNYEEFVQSEFGDEPRPRGISTLWWITALLVLLAMFAVYIYSAAR